MPQHDRIRAVSQAPSWWPNANTLRSIVETHWVLYSQLEQVFGSRIACETIVACVMRIRL
jgi:hypothetical protein